MDSELEQADALMTSGREAYVAGDYPAARERFEQALTIRQRVLGDRHADVGKSIHFLGIVLDDLGDPAGARKHLEQALEIYKLDPGETHRNIAKCLTSLGNVSTALGDYPKARESLEEALALSRERLGDQHPDVTDSLNNLGILHDTLGDRVVAHSYFSQALALRKAVLGDRHPDVATSLNNIGTSHLRLGDYAEALACHEQALDIRRQHWGEAHPEVASSLCSLGSVRIKLGDYDAAKVLYEEALAIRRRVHGDTHPQTALSFNYLGVASHCKDDYVLAREYHEKALTVWRQLFGETHPNVTMSLDNIGAALVEAGDAAGARKCYEQALKIRQEQFGETHPDLHYNLHSLAILDRREGAFDRAAQWLDWNYRIAVSPGGDEYLPGVYHQLSRLKAAEVQPDAAIFFGKQAVNAIQRQRGRLTGLSADLQRSFVATKESFYRDLSDLLIEAGRLGEAQQVLAMLKEEELFDLLRRDAASDPRLTLAQLTSLEAEWQRHGDVLGRSLSRMTAELAELRRLAARDDAQEARLKAVRAELDAVGREFRTWLDGLRGDLVRQGSESAHSAALNLDLLERMQGELRGLGPGVALVSYVLGTAKLSIILTTATFQVSREAEISEKTINRLVHEFRLAIDQRLDADVRRTAQALWRHLIAPIADQLAQTAATTLMIVPYGTLRYLPWSALMDGERYLVESYAVSILTLAAHGSLQGRRAEAWQVAGLGVSREVPGYRKLLAVAEELSGIVRVAPGGSGIYPGTIRLDEAFTEQGFADVLGGHEAVHVASHFVLNPAQGLSSHLLLGDGTNLSLERLRDVSFDFHGVELMTLSACETAMGGGVENGREFEGFAALVQQRGVKAVLASLWPVADESTAPLMTEFYRARREGLSKAAALRQAQIETLKGRHAHPYHWAPFVLLGNWL